ncbi:hypothetical protein [Kitasatospora sp. NBC_00315]|uniref:hypothetical protein n=1 Tax=Kitasatospora sp. NBC_00315 TaxID=2975963 RepID=UPI00324D1BFA
MRLPVRLPAAPRARLRGLLTALGTAALVLGATAPAALADQPAEAPEQSTLIGWFAYGPLPDAGAPLALVPAYGRPEPRPAR